MLAAGFGKRLRPLTLNTPKCLVKVNEKPILEEWIEKLESIRTQKVIINTHYLHEKVNHELINYRHLSEKDYSNQLSLQIHSPVMWSDTIKKLLEKRMDSFIEIGPKKTLLNFLPRQFQGNKMSLSNLEDVSFV